MTWSALSGLPLAFEEIVVSDSAAFRAFYSLYEAAFPLADERESPQAFDAILEFNQDLAVQREWGPYREWVVAIRAWEGGPIIGGHVFGAATSTAHRAAGVAATVQGIYTFVHPGARGSLSLREVMRYSQRSASTLFAPPDFPPRAQPPILFEVNNPLRMSAQQIAADALSSGTDPSRRYLFWNRMGGRPLDFPYVQPALRADASPVDYLDLFCWCEGLAEFPASLLLAHLNAFVGVSCLKGDRALVEPSLGAMQRWLKARETVEFTSPADEQWARIRSQALTSIRNT